MFFNSRLCASVPFVITVSHVNINYLQVLFEFSLTSQYNYMLKTVFNIALYCSKLFSQSLLVQLTVITCQEFFAIT